jgi:hypothetical protein
VRSYCQNFLGPYEESGASLYKKPQVHEKSKKTRGINNVKWQTPENASTQSTPSSNGSDLAAMVAALQSQFNTLQTTMGTQLQGPRQTPTPPQTPSTRQAHPTIIVGFQLPRLTRGRRISRLPILRILQCLVHSLSGRLVGIVRIHPEAKVCLLPPGLLNGNRARARFYSFGKYAAHPVISRALAHCRPCDATMTKPHVDDLRRDVTEWTNETGCAYRAFRPLAPPNTAPAEEWKYGTGDGAHNPVVCKP